jgi:hypothetical protein
VRVSATGRREILRTATGDSEHDAYCTVFLRGRRGRG